MFVHATKGVMLQPPLEVRHSFTSVQVIPLPVYPALQPHVYAPSVFVQVAVVAQVSVPAAHSLTSVQVTPSPMYPAGQAPHELPPGVFVHATSGEVLHPPLAVRHSFTSVQTVPLPE